jgi:hypothetical protein
MCSAILLAVVLAGPGGCSKGDAPTADLSSPQSAAVALARAVQAGDGDGIRAAAIGSDQEVAGLLAMGKGQLAVEELCKACDEKFGKDNEVSRTLRKGADIVSVAEKATYTVTGDAATMTEGPDDKSPTRLRKVNGKWKVELSSMSALSAGPDGKVAKAPEAEKAFREAAADVRSGKYATLKDAMRGIGQKLASL